MCFWGEGRQVLNPSCPLCLPAGARGTGDGSLNAHWSTILRVFEGLLETLQQNFVPDFLVRKLFEQLFSFVNVQLFNQLLLRRECCSFSNGEYVKTGLSEVEMWISSAGREWVGDSWDQLSHIRQVGQARSRGCTHAWRGVGCCPGT